MMKLADHIGEEYTEQQAKNFLFYESISFLKMLQGVNGNLHLLDSVNKEFAIDEMNHILAMSEEVDAKFGNPEKDMLELLKGEIDKINLESGKELIEYLYGFAKGENDKRRGRGVVKG